MNSIGNKLLEKRKSKGLTQEELAELSKVNLRTIQRIENNENEPRGKTLNLICDVLEINSFDLFEEVKVTTSSKLTSIIINGIFLILLNLVLMGLISFLTLGPQANINSRIGALILSFFIPFFIVYWTQSLTGIERLLKYGFGYMSFIFLFIYAQGLGRALQSGLTSNFSYLCLIISIGVLYYGKFFLGIKK